MGLRFGEVHLEDDTWEPRPLDKGLRALGLAGKQKKHKPTWVGVFKKTKGYFCWKKGLGFGFGTSPPSFSS